MRVLALSTPYPSHAASLLPLLHALRDAGHHVLVAAQPDVVDVVEAAGLGAATVGERYHGLDNMHASLPAGTRPLRAFGRPGPTRAIASSWYLHANYLLPRYLDFAEAWRPDLVLSEQLEFCGTLIAAVLGVPCVQQRWGVDSFSGLARELARTGLLAACRRHGLDALPDPDLLLDPCPPSLQVPGVAEGAPLRHTSDAGAGLLLDPPAFRRVCVTLGRQTLQLNGVPLLRSIVTAAAGLPDVETVVTVAPEFRATLGSVPAGVRLIPDTPLHRVLPGCAAVVSHGGAGTVLAALDHGVPQLVLPQFQDQFGTAERLVTRLAGVAVDDADDQDDPQVVREALRQVLDDGRHRVAAAALSAEMARMPTPADVVDRLPGQLVR